MGVMILFFISSVLLAAIPGALSYMMESQSRM